MSPGSMPLRDCLSCVPLHYTIEPFRPPYRFRSETTGRFPLALTVAMARLSDEASNGDDDEEDDDADDDQAGGTACWE